VTGPGRGRRDRPWVEPTRFDASPPLLADTAAAVLCREYAALAGSPVPALADFLHEVAALAIRLLPSARRARIRVRHPEVVTATAPDRVEPDAASRPGILAIPLVGRGDLAGMLELDPAGPAGFPPYERELAEVLAVLLTLSLAAGRAA
jgi:hypothetical protein